MKIWKTAVYLRLSRDDGDVGESMSIQNQKSLIDNWVLNQKGENIIDVVDYYIDDGFTGTNFDRPSFERMMLDVKSQVINCVIVKDLSRLGRNFSKVSYLIDEYFPRNNIRFIAINDSIDTGGYIDDNDATSFKLVFNEYYVKDISKKVKTALRASARRGNYVGANPPYGYKRSSEDYHKLVIDEEVADNVREMFKRIIDGESGRAIADDFNRRKILTPLNYKKTCRHEEIDPLASWNSNTILQIVRNDVYFGRLVQHKVEKVSYKLNYKRETEKEEQIVTEDAHEPIISKELESEVKKALDHEWKINNKTNKNGERLPVMFSGVLKCADCGSNLSGTTKNGKRVYRCYKYNNSGKNACSSHLIYEHILEKLVIRDIKRLIYDYNKDPDTFIDNIVSNQSNINRELQEIVNKRKEKVQAKLDKIKDIMANLYEDRLDKTITKEMFVSLSEKYNKESEELLSQMKKFDTILVSYNCTKLGVTQWVENLLKFNDFENGKPDKEYYRSIIKYIYVKENTIQYGDRIIIQYKVGYMTDSKDVEQIQEMKLNS